MNNSYLYRIVNSFTNNLLVEQRYRMILEGLQVTLLITLCSVILGTLLGGLVCWARMSRHAWLQRLAKIYIDLMRGTPVLVLLMLMYYVFMAPLGTTGVVVAIVTFGLNTSAYIGEMLRSGIESIDKGQREAGLALGYTPRQVFMRIILPQVVRKIMPVYLGEVISLLKGTSIVGYIAVMDMTRASDLIRSRTFDAFFPLIVTAAIYFLVAWLIGLLFNSLLEKRRTRAIVAAVTLLVLALLGSVPSIMEYSHKNDSDQTVPPLFLQLEGRPVGTVIGSIQDIAVTRYAPKADIMRFSSMTDLYASLQNGKTDVLVGENITVLANPTLMEWIDTIDAGMPPTAVAICMQLGNTALQQDLNNYLAEIRADGTYQKLNDRWMENKDISQNPVPKQRGTGKTIIVGTFPGMPPYNFIKNGEPSGFEIDLLTEWANRRNYRMEFLFMEFASQIPAVQTGKVDLSIGSIAVTEERQKNVLFTDGYYFGRILFYTRKGELEKIFKNE
jgi:polar amino acid transport system substrate-binding protein